MKKTLLFSALTLSLSIGCGGGSRGGAGGATPTPTPVSGQAFAGCFRFVKSAGCNNKKSSAEVTPLAASVAMSSPRTNHTATLLPDGTVLLVGGRDSNGIALRSAEIFDPVTETHTLLGAQLQFGRADHAAVLVPGNGRPATVSNVVSNPSVMIIGGTQNGANDNVVEFYDTVTQQFASKSLGFTIGGLGSGIDLDMKAYSLGDGNVLVLGGHQDAQSPAQAFVLSTIQDTISHTVIDSSLLNREFASSVQLPDGRVVVTGGSTDAAHSCASQDIILVDGHTRSAQTIASLNQQRCKHAMALLADGSVAVYGGTDNNGNALASVERIVLSGTPHADAVGNLPAGRSLINATVVSTGMALIVGGDGPDGLATGSQLIFDHSDNVSGTTGSLNEARDDYAMVPLANGLVYVSGGKSGSTVSSTAEVFDPLNAVSLKYPSSVVTLNVDGDTPTANNVTFTSVLPAGVTVTWTAEFGTVVDNHNGTATYTPPLALDTGKPPRIDPARQIIKDLVTITSNQNAAVKASAEISITYSNPQP